jgi:hypothetical protein
MFDGSSAERIRDKMRTKHSAGEMVFRGGHSPPGGSPRFKGSGVELDEVVDSHRPRIESGGPLTGCFLS